MVTTPEGPKISYDSRGDDRKTYYEAKTGYQLWELMADVPNSWKRKPGLQFKRQVYVAARCGFNYVIAVDNKIGALGLVNYFPGFPISYIPKK